MRLIVVILFACFLISCSGKESSQETAKQSYENTKNTLLEKETKHPAMFLHVTGGSKKNLVGQTVVKGKISNTATVAKFKDIHVKLDFYSKTKTLLETDNETIYMELNPGETQKFKTKYFAPKGTDSVALSVVSAKSLE